MGGPLVTIAIPAFNEARFIRDTILSALAQSYSNIEVIVGDNASTDGTGGIAHELAINDRRLRVHRHSSNVGANRNFVYLCHHAKGQYFMWLGAHDLLAPRFVEGAVEVLATEDAMLVYPRCNFVDECFPAIVTGCGDSDIASRGRSRLSAACLVAMRLEKCTAIHGLFRTCLLQRLPIDPIYGGDDLILFLTAAYGRIVSSKEVGLLRRLPRTEESPGERAQRYAAMGVLKDVAQYDRAVTAAHHLKWIWRLPHFSAAQKIQVAARFLAIYKWRYGISLCRVGSMFTALRHSEPGRVLPHPHELGCNWIYPSGDAAKDGRKM